jgi:hypothetical protein
MTKGHTGAQCRLGCRTLPRPALVIEVAALPARAGEHVGSLVSFDLSAPRNRAYPHVVLTVPAPPPRMTASHT